MVLRRALGAASLAVLLVTARGPAFAAEPTADAKAEAARLDATAAGLSKSGAHREALAALRRSNSLAPKAATLQRIAAIQREMKDFAGAYATLSEVLTTYGSSLPAAQKKEIERSRGELEAITGALHVKAAEAGAHVELDGNPLGDGPLDAHVRVNLGQHTVHATLPGALPFDAKVDATNPQAEVPVTVAFKLQNGVLSVRLRGKPMSIRIDGKDVGPSPFESELPPGKHVVEVGEPPDVLRREVEIVGGKRADLELAPQVPTRVTIRVSPGSAKITVDGQVRGQGEWSGSLAPGRHVVDATLEGYTPAHTVIEGLEAGESRLLRVNVFRVPFQASYEGMYAQFNGALLIAPSPSNFVNDQCDLRPSKCTGPGAAFGGAIPIRVGYSFGTFGVEVVTGPRFDAMGKKIDLGRGDNETFLIWRAALINGIGGRFMPKTDGVRFSTGLALAWVHSFLNLNASPHKAKYLPEPSPQDNAPMLLADAAVLFGHTPGAKFRLGLEASLDFLGDGAASDTMPTVVLAHGTTFFIGPVFGAQIGH